MKRYYTIGETAALLGVTTQTLRYYDKIGLLSPASVDPHTGYRYYAFSQFHYIDRIKYLQGFGMPLEEISSVVHSGRVDRLLPYLQKKREETVQELEKIQKRVRDIEWYMEYFTYLDRGENAEDLYKVQLPERYVLSVPCLRGEPLAEMEIRLAREKSLPDCVNLAYNRQYGYRIQVDAMLRRSFVPEAYFIFLREPPKTADVHFQTLPAGEYLCLRSQVLREDWNPDALTACCQKEKPTLALALEFEDNLDEYSQAWYEMEIYLPPL